APPRDGRPVRAEPASGLPGGDRDRRRGQPRHGRMAGRPRGGLLHRRRAAAHALGGAGALPGIPRGIPGLRGPGSALLPQPAAAALTQADAPTAPARPSGVAGPAAGRSPGAVTRLLSTRALLVGGVMVVIASLFTTAEQDPDFWWHLRIGEWMVQNGRLPSTDIFTFTVPAHAWTDHEYLTEIVMWLVYSSAGLVGISLLFGVVTWVGWWFIYRQVYRQPFVIVG